MALHLTWDALPPQGDLPLKHGVVNHEYHYPQRRGTLPPLHPITAQLPTLTAEVPLSSDTVSQHICQRRRSFLLSLVLVTSRGTWVNDFPPNLPPAAF